MHKRIPHSQKNMFYKVIFLFLLAVVSSQAFSKQTELMRVGATEIKYRLGVPITFSIETRQRAAMKQSEFELFRDSGYPFGATTLDDSVIANIRVQWGTLPVTYLATSAVSDLFNSTSVAILLKGQHLLMIIDGGDASSSYQAELEIAPHGVVARRVFHRLSGYQETSVYSFPKEYVEAVSRDAKRNVNDEQNKLKGSNATK
jgi:hypothetical protein